MQQDDRRLRRYMIPMHEALSLLRMAFHELGGCKYIELPEGRGIPEGATVRSVYFDDHSQCFGIIVAHESFGPIPHGYEIPRQGTASLERRAFEVLKTTCEGGEPVDAIAVDRNGQPICNSRGEPVPVGPLPRGAICDGHALSKLVCGDWQIIANAFIEGADAGSGTGAAEIFTPDKTTLPKPGGLEQFTDRARKVLQLANQEAQRHNHDWLGAEHLLLGLIKEGSGVAGHVLASLGANWEKTRRVARDVLEYAPSMVTMGKLPETVRTKRVLESARHESVRLEHGYVGTEHILLGLLLEFTKEITDAGGLIDVGAMSDAFRLFDALGLAVVPVRIETLRLLGVDVSKAATPLDKSEWVELDKGVMDAFNELDKVLGKPGSCQCPSLLHGHLPGCPEAK